MKELKFRTNFRFSYKVGRHIGTDKQFVLLFFFDHLRPAVDRLRVNVLKPCIGQTLTFLNFNVFLFVIIFISVLLYGYEKFKIRIKN